MPQYKHVKTQRPAVFVDDVKHMDDAIEIKTYEDLPSIAFWEQLGTVAPELLYQGKQALDGFFRAFFKRNTKVYYVNIFPSGFPEGVVDLK